MRLEKSRDRKHGVTTSFAGQRGIEEMGSSEVLGLRQFTLIIYLPCSNPFCFFAFTTSFVFKHNGVIQRKVGEAFKNQMHFFLYFLETVRCEINMYQGKQQLPFKKLIRIKF